MNKTIQYRVTTLCSCVMIVISSLCAQRTMNSEIFRDDIKTLQIKTNDNPLTPPIIYLGSDDFLTISFDQMTHNYSTFRYRIRHCNADWTLSSLLTSEYLNGFDTNDIDDHALSVNTTFLYTNYQFTLPNNSVSFTISGNYVVDIFEGTNSDAPVARVLFYVVDPKIGIDATLRGNTDMEINTSLQQIDFDIVTSNYQISDPQTELKVVVKQNNRIDNAVTDLKPTFLAANRLRYINNRRLIFEGGNEYHRIDFSSRYNYDERIDEIKFNGSHFDVYATAFPIRANRHYQSDFDVNGRFVVNYQNGTDSDTEADYMYVHLFLPIAAPFNPGDVYLGGEWNYNLINDASRMEYDYSENGYFKTLLLKQGGYNFQLWNVRSLSESATTRPIDGSYWQTQNEYIIYVYHRPWGSRYDQLIGIKILQ